MIIDYYFVLTSNYIKISILSWPLSVFWSYPVFIIYFGLWPWSQFQIIYSREVKEHLLLVSLLVMTSFFPAFLLLLFTVVTQSLLVCCVTFVLLMKFSYNVQIVCQGGFYYGRISFPPEYPFKPPSIRYLSCFTELMYF